MSMTQTSSRSLPEDLIMEILTRLPVKSLVRFKSASKSLLNLIISSEFVKLHGRRSHIRNSTVALQPRVLNNCFASVDFDQPQRPAVKHDIHPDIINILHPFRSEKKFRIPKILGICNGVVCLKTREEFVLYNPATREYKQVPRRKLSSFALDHDEFVYDCISDGFKIFQFINRWDVETQKYYYSESYMYNLKDNSWSKIGNPPPRIHVPNEESCYHIATNYLYWIAINDSKVEVLVRFNVSSNTYEEILFPTRVNPSFRPKLGVLNGRLHITRYGDNSDIWMLKEDNCWAQVFRCSGWEYCPKYCLFQSIDGRKIFFGMKKNYQKFICCDLESQTTSVVQIAGLRERETIRVIPWVESLAPIA